MKICTEADPPYKNFKSKVKTKPWKIALLINDDVKSSSLAIIDINSKYVTESCYCFNERKVKMIV